MVEGCVDDRFPLQGLFLIEPWIALLVLLGLVVGIAGLLWFLRGRWKWLALVPTVLALWFSVGDYVSAWNNIHYARSLVEDSELRGTMLAEAGDSDEFGTVFRGTLTRYGEVMRVAAVRIVDASPCSAGYLVRKDGPESLPDLPRSYQDYVQMQLAARRMICRNFGSESDLSDEQRETLRQCEPGFERLEVFHPIARNGQSNIPPLTFQWCKPLEVSWGDTAYCEASKLSGFYAAGNHF